MSETQAQEQKITLTLTPEEVKEEQQTQLQNLEEEKQEEPKKGKTLEEMYQDAHLSEAERKTVEDFSEKINIIFPHSKTCGKIMTAEFHKCFRRSSQGIKQGKSRNTASRADRTVTRSADDDTRLSVFFNQL